MDLMSAERLPLEESQGDIVSDVDADQHAKNADAIRLLEAWSQGDEQEQKETWQFLRVALDEDRLSDRKLFP